MPALDGLLGLAVLGVLLFHAGHLVGGFLGVDLFFTLSGFLITSLLLAEGAQVGRIGLGGFWARRARRLLPALAVVLVAVAFYAWFLADPDELVRIRGDALATIGYVANWREVFAGQDYWLLFLGASPLQHTWSLAIEEQFYLVWPLVVSGLLVVTGRRRLPAVLLGVSLVLAAGSAWLMSALDEPGEHTRTYYGTDTRAAAILLGVSLAAFLALRGPVRSLAARVALEVAAVAGVVLLALAWINADGRSDYLYDAGFLALAVAATAVIAGAAHPRPSVVGRALSFPPLRWVGLVSYGAYLWHWPVFVVLDDGSTSLSGWGLVAARLAVTFAIAAASYVLLERPIRHGALTPRQWLVAAPTTAAVVVTALLLATSGSIPGATEPSAPVQADSMDVAMGVASAAPPDAERVMVVGNSVGTYLGRGLREITFERPAAVANFAVPACTFPPGAGRLRGFDGVIGFDAADCTSYWPTAVGGFQPDLVLLALADPGAYDVEYDGTFLHACTPEYGDRYYRGLREAIDVLSAGGARVAVVAPAYTAPVMNAGAAEAGVERTDCVNDMNRMVAAADPRAAYIDLNHFVCPDGLRSCKAEIDGVELRPDGVHYDGEGARLVGRWILEQARAATY
ncbi:acyltransferase family protein [soil metagenome]